jgi:hypothetical protein
MPVEDYTKFSEPFENEGIYHLVFYRGAGPDIIILHEIFGMLKECVALGDRVAGDHRLSPTPLRPAGKGVMAECNAPLHQPRVQVHGCAQVEPDHDAAAYAIVVDFLRRHLLGAS